MYWSGVSLNSFTTCSNDVTVGTTGPIGSGLPQFGLPRRFAIDYGPFLVVVLVPSQRMLMMYQTWSDAVPQSTNFTPKYWEKQGLRWLTAGGFRAGDGYKNSLFIIKMTTVVNVVYLFAMASGWYCWLW
jgi:hypothetical protein